MYLVEQLFDARATLVEPRHHLLQAVRQVVSVCWVMGLGFRLWGLGFGAYSFELRVEG